jgi:hypothetical protein
MIKKRNFSVTNALQSSNRRSLWMRMLKPSMAIVEKCSTRKTIWKGMKKHMKIGNIVYLMYD